MLVKGFVFGTLSPWKARLFDLLLEFFEFGVRIVGGFVEVHELGESFFKVLDFLIAGFKLFFELDVFFVVPHEGLFARTVQDVNQSFSRLDLQVFVVFEIRLLGGDSKPIDLWDWFLGGLYLSNSRECSCFLGL